MNLAGLRRMVFNTFLVPFGVTFSVYLPAQAANIRTTVDPTIPAMKDQIKKDFGPVIKEGTLPATLAFMNSLLKPLAAGLQKVDRGQSTHLIYPFIFETEEGQAEAYSTERGGVSSHILAISKSFLENLVSKKDGNFAETYFNVAGSYAYLLGKNLVNQEFPDMSEKEASLRAAVKGTELAIASGLPADSVYRMLKNLNQNKSENRELLATLLAKDTQLDLQLSAVRTYLVSRSFHLGEAMQERSDIPNAQLVSKMTAEVRAENNDSKWNFVAPKDLAQALERIKALSGDRTNTEEFRQIEFHRLLTFAMDLADRIFEKSGTLGPKNLETYRELVKFITDNGQHYKTQDVGTYEMNFEVDTLKVDWPKTRYGRSHAKHLREATFFRSAEYQNLVGGVIAEKLDFIQNHRDLRSIEAAQKLSMFLRYASSGVILPEQVIAASGDLGERALEYTDWIGRRAKMSMQLMLDSSPSEVQFEFTAELYNRALKKESIEVKLKMMEATGYLRFLPIPEYTVHARGLSRDELRQKKEVEQAWERLVKRAAAGDAHAKMVTETYLAFIEEFWVNRAQFAILDLTRSEKIWWGWIGQLKGLTYDQTNAAIRASVNELLNSDPQIAPPGSQVSYSSLLRILEGKRANYSLEPVLVPWLDESIRPLIAAKLVPGSKEAAAAKIVLEGALIKFNPALVKDTYRSALAKVIQQSLGKPITYQDLQNFHEHALETAFGSEYKSMAASKDGLFLRVLVDELLASRHSAATIDAALSELLIKDQAVGMHGLRDKIWYTAIEDKSDMDYFVQLQVDRGLLERPSLVLERIIKIPGDDDSYTSPKKYYTSYVANFFAPLAREAQALNSHAEIVRFLNLLFPVSKLPKLSESTSQGGQAIELRRLALAQAAKLPLSYEQSKEIFDLVTMQGPTQATDKWFVEKIWPRFSRDYRWARGLRKYLGYKADEREKPRQFIKSTALRQQFAEYLLEPKVKALSANQDRDPKEIQALLMELDAYVPERTLRKDELLEAWSFRLDAKGSQLRDLFESRKLVGASANTTPVNAGLQSGLVQMLSDLKEDSRIDLIAFMRDPENYQLGLPEELVHKIQDQVIEEEYRKSDGNSGKETFRSEARFQTLALKEKIESTLRDSSPMERIFIFELLLTAGPNALAKQNNYFGTLVERFLKITPTSLHGQSLRVYVDLFPQEFRTVPLAYLLSLSGAGDTGVVELIKVFRAVGFQFAQVAPLFKVFDEETNRQMQTLKDQTTPLAHVEIEQEAQKQLAPDDYAKIEKFERVLASGSIKTVVLVKLKGGANLYAVLYLVNPNAAAQIDYNLNLSGQFIDGLKKNGIESSSPLFKMLIAGLRDRMKRELRMDIETELTSLARASIQQFLKENPKLVPQGWRVQVAEPEVGTSIAKSAALFKYFKGRTLRHWREEVKSGRLTDPAAIALLNQVNELVFRSAVHDFFRNGIFDPDRHTGNILVDFEGKTISFIDYGKLEDFREPSFGHDPRMLVAQFLGAMNDRDAVSVVDAAILMSQDGKMNAGQRLRLIELLNSKFKSLSADAVVDSDLIHSVLSLSAQQGVAFETRYLLGVFKGLLMLFGENYVDSKVGAEIVRSEVIRLYRSHPVDFITSQARSLWNRAAHAMPAWFSPAARPQKSCEDELGSGAAKKRNR